MSPAKSRCVTIGIAVAIVSAVLLFFLIAETL